MPSEPINSKKLPGDSRTSLKKGKIKAKTSIAGTHCNNFLWLISDILFFMLHKLACRIPMGGIPVILSCFILINYISGRKSSKLINPEI